MQPDLDVVWPIRCSPELDVKNPCISAETQDIFLMPGVHQNDSE